MLEEFRQLSTDEQEEYFIKRQRDMSKLAQSTAQKYGEIAQLSNELIIPIQGIFDMCLKERERDGYYSEREIFINVNYLASVLRSSCDYTLTYPKIKKVMDYLGIEHSQDSTGKKRGYKFICAYWKNPKTGELETETKKELPQLSSNDIINNVQSIAK